jgi:hypothetical protein
MFHRYPSSEDVTIQWHTLGGQLYSSEDVAILLIVCGAANPGSEAPTLSDNFCGRFGGEPRWTKF